MGETRYVLHITLRLVAIFVAIAVLGAWLRNWERLRLFDNVVADLAVSYALVWISPIIGYISGKRGWKAVVATYDASLPPGRTLKGSG